MQNAAERVAALREKMKAAGVQAYLIPSADPHLSEYTPAHWQARKYFSGFTGSAGTLVVTDHKAGLWTDGRYFVQAERELEGSGIRLYRMAGKGVPTYPEFVRDELSGGDTACFDGSLFSAADVRKMRRLFAEKGISVRQADLILVMKQGDIVEQGNHDQLMAKGGVYAELYNSQFARAE